MFCNLHRQRFCVLAFLTIIFSAQAQKPNLSFSFEEEKEGIRLYSAEDTFHRLTVVKGEVLVNASAREVLYLLQDSKHAHLWVNEVRRMETIANRGDSVWVSRAFIHFPFPFKDRVLVLENILNKGSSNGFRISQRVCVKYYSAESEYVPILDAYGYWEVQSNKRGTSKIIYIFAADVRVSLPAYLEKKNGAGRYVWHFKKNAPYFGK